MCIRLVCRLYERLCYVFLFNIYVYIKYFFVTKLLKKVHLLQERLYYLLFIPLFCKFILKDNIFKHHYFSLLIAMVGFSLLFIPICLKIDVDDIVPNVLNFVGSVGYSLFLVIIKYLTHVYYMSPFKLSLIFGTIAFFFIFFGFLIYSLIKYAAIVSLAGGLIYFFIRPFFTNHWHRGSCNGSGCGRHRD